MLICVDLDGTLLDTVPANAASYRAALEELGFTVTDEYYAERCNGGHYTRFLPPLMGGAPSAADVERVHDRKRRCTVTSRCGAPEHGTDGNFEDDARRRA